MPEKRTTGEGNEKIYIKRYAAAAVGIDPRINPRSLNELFPFWEGGGISLAWLLRKIAFVKCLFFLAPLVFSRPVEAARSNDAHFEQQNNYHFSKTSLTGELNSPRVVNRFI